MRAGAKVFLVPKAANEAADAADEAKGHDLTVIGTGEGSDGRPVRVNTGDVLLAR